MARIFISYRRDDTEGDAGRLYDWLTREFGKENIFIDFDDILPGSDFRNVIDRELSRCSVMLVLIGSYWLTVVNEYDRQRLFLSNDLVRQEIMTALRRGITVIPVLFRDARVPSATLLPEPLRDLSSRNAISLDNRCFHDDIKRLVEYLHVVLNEIDQQCSDQPSDFFPTEDYEPETVLIQQPQFIMGSDPRHDPDAEEREQPPHAEFLNTYRIGKYPVTVGQYRAFVRRGGYENPQFWTRLGWHHREQRNWDFPRLWEGTRWTSDDRQPVVTVSWYEALAYAEWLSTVTGRWYRLPTESEWECAARGINGFRYPWGNEWCDRSCNTVEAGIMVPTPVDYFSPRGESTFGVADMAGNVQEWCMTKARGSYGVPEDNADDGHYGRVVRGGSYKLEKRRARTASRGWAAPYDWEADIGFRVVCVSEQ